MKLAIWRKPAHTFRKLPDNSGARRFFCDRGCDRRAEWEAIPASSTARRMGGSLLLCDPHKREVEKG